VDIAAILGVGERDFRVIAETDDTRTLVVEGVEQEALEAVVAAADPEAHAAAEAVAQVRMARAREYAPIGEQLDMLFHDAQDGTTTWKDHIVAVKAAHPKPEV
jgi:hypothetical protein